jgi:hypothetical protein
MEDIIDLIATGSAASDVSDKIKEILYAKSAERIDLARPLVAQGMFGEQESEYEEGEEIEVDDTEEDYTEEEQA